jgi:hypothetical protein
MQVTAYLDIFVGDDMKPIKATADIVEDNFWVTTFEVSNIKASWEGKDFTEESLKHYNIRDVKHCLREEYKHARIGVRT